MAHDCKGTELFPGDRVKLECVVTHVEGDHILTKAENPPQREFWFVGSAVELTAQGALSKDKEAQTLKAAVAAATPAPVEPIEATNSCSAVVSGKEQAVAYLEAGGMPHDQAVQTVEEEGVRAVLAQKSADKAAAAAAPAEAVPTSELPKA